MSTESYQEVIQRNLWIDPDTGERESWRACVSRMSASAATLPSVIAERDEALRDVERVVAQCRVEAAGGRRARRIQSKLGICLFLSGLLGFCGWSCVVYLLLLARG